MEGEQTPKRHKLAWQPDIIKIDLNRTESGPSLDQIDRAARVLQRDWPHIETARGLQPRPTREIWADLMARLAERDPQLAHRLGRWTAFDGVIRALQYGLPQRECLWSFRREVRCELVVSNGLHGVIVETAHGRRYQNFFADRAAAVAHAQMLGDQLRQSGRWTEEGGSQ